MKLSELSTDQALDVLCELTPYISNIASDSAVLEAVGKTLAPAREMNLYGNALLLAERMGEVIPALLKTHRSDVYGILAVLNQKSRAEISAQPIGDTIRQLKELFQDEDLLSFFKSSGPPARTEPSAPSAPCPGSA